MTNGRPPVPPRNKLGQSGPSGLDELTNKVFEDLMQGKSEVAHSFDELGILDPDRPVKVSLIHVWIYDIYIWYNTQLS